METNNVYSTHCTLYISVIVKNAAKTKGTVNRKVWPTASQTVNHRRNDFAKPPECYQCRQFCLETFPAKAAILSETTWMRLLTDVHIGTLEICR